MDRFNMEAILQLKELIVKKTRTVIVTHVNPDGDAMGSSLAWYTFLKSMGIEVTVILPNRFPEFLSWLSGSGEAIVYNENKELAKSVLEKAEVLYCMDFNTISRLDDLGSEIESLELKHVLIDHHLNPPSDFYLSFSCVPISSTCEITFRLIEALGEKQRITKEIGESLYTGILTDTGKFSHSCGDPDLFRIVADLIEVGIDQNKVQHYLYNNFSADRMRLLGYTLFKGMVVIPEYRTAYICLTREELDCFNFQSGDTEGFVNLPLSIKDIRLAILFAENSSGVIKVSLRSTGDFSVNDLSNKYFNGGGHKNAAGGKLNIPMLDAVELLKRILPEYQEELLGLF